MTPPTFAAALTLVTVLPLAASPARAEEIFVRIAGAIQGTLQGWYNPVDELDEVSLVEYGRVEDLAWSMVSPRDAASGLPTGKRQHRALTLRTRMAAATTFVGNAMANNENLPSVEVQWFGPDPETGVATRLRKLYLVNANIASLSLYTVREDGELMTYMDFSLTYQKIGIEDAAAGLSFEDDWESPVAAPTIE